jgi:F-type H+-transporting ATPase subunit alpha
VEIFTKFGARVEEETKALISRGQRLREVLKQPRFSGLGLAEQVVVFFMLNEGYLDSIKLENVSAFVNSKLHKVKTTMPDVIEEINSTGELTLTLKNKLINLFNGDNR